MRYISLLLCLFLLAATVSAGDIKLVDSARNGVSIEWNLESYQIENVGGYTVVQFPGGSGLYAVGKPNLPSQQTFVEIPMDAEPVLHITGQTIETLKLRAPIVPSQEPEVDTIGAEQILPRALAMDDASYKSADPFPGNVVEIAYQGIMRGRKLALVRINPIQYIAKTGELRVYKNLTFEVEFKGATRGVAETDNGMDPIAQAMIINYKAGKARQRNDVDYLVITVPELENNARNFLQWKQQKGLNGKLEVLGRNPAESEVKDLIKQYYPQVKFVLLVADHGQIKLPKSANRHPLGQERCQMLGLEDGSVPSDNYYACVDGTDYYPDVYVGRIPAGNAEEADILMGKLLKYQKTPPTGDWSQRFLLCGEFQYQYGTKNMAERLFCETAFTIFNSLSSKYTFPSRTIGTGSSGLNHSTYYFRKAKNPSDPTRPGTYRSKVRDAQGPVVNCQMPAEWTKNIVSNSEARENTLTFWEEGAFWVQHRDHGSNTSWGKPSLSKTDVQNLKNGDKLPILFSINCLTGSMDYSSDCFVEAALKNPNGGAVAAIGSTRVSYSWWNDRLCDGFYTCVFGTENYDCLDTGINLPTKHPFSNKLGVVLNFGKMYLAKNYPSNPFGTSYDYTETEFYLFHCIGDPEMQIWTGALDKLEVNAQRGSISVVSKASRAPIQNATVCVFNGKTQIVVKTDAKGHCSIPADAAGTLTITGNGLYPYQTTIGK